MTTRIMQRTLRDLPVLVVWLLVACTVQAQPSSAPASAGPADAEAEAAKAAVLGFTRALDYFDLEGFANSFSEDATLFFPMPWSPDRVDGRAAIRDAQAKEFARARKRFAEAGKTTPPFLNLVALDMHVQKVGAHVAVVTWHVDRGTHLGRRTAVVHKTDGRWQIASFHASNMDKPMQ